MTPELKQAELDRRMALLFDIYNYLYHTLPTGRDLGMLTDLIQRLRDELWGIAA